MIHLMELPNPDPPTGKPQHGRRDRREFFARTLRLRHGFSKQAKFDLYVISQSIG
ncbi:hypothetical protein HanIR_Chr09g0426261 [Helianthus annuus]|nr:hypothetical protein HanIR_Chr09g0426261 [Helianthus annuus]